ncbi:MAG: putative glycoside hydrolase, partial [Aggregatilineales bacterium]
FMNWQPRLNLRWPQMALKRKCRGLLVMIALVVVCLLLPENSRVTVTTPVAKAATSPCNLFPFVYTAEVLYGAFGGAQPGGCYPTDQAAKFDLLITSPSKYKSTSWCNRPSNAFQAIKAINPRTSIMLYRMGPGQYITASWGAIGDGWDWIKQNHGKGTADRWTALGVSSTDYLVALPYPVERAMEIGNPNWQEYWMRRNYEDIWVNRINNMNGDYTDGIFADGMQYSVSWSNRWCAEGTYSNGACSQLDHPATYYRNNAYDEALWRQHYDQFMERAVPYFRQRGLAFGVNAWRIGYPAQHQLYERLRVVAMEECGFLCVGRTQLDKWEQKMRALQDATAYAVISVNLPPGYRSDNPGNAMDDTYCADGICQTGWQWLWYSLGSYLLGYEPQRQNAYFYFSLWEYRGTFWFDEYDPRYLHLGLPRAQAQKLNTGLWIREFERGWVVVNPTLQTQTVSVPSGYARLLDHDNFKQPQNAARGQQFSIGSLQGRILLKDPQPPGACVAYMPLVNR